MERVLRRAKYAERQARKKVNKRKAFLESTEDWQRMQQTRRIVRVYNQNIVEARKNRREDWELGPLAPRRDAGEKSKTYGTYSVYDFSLPELGKKERMDFVPISEGDRVVVVKGRDRGRIGEVQELQRDRNGVRLDGLNIVDVAVPAYMRGDGSESEETGIESISQFIPIEHVRLVYPLPDPATGQPRDVIIDRLECFRLPGKKRNSRDHNDLDHEFERYIPGTNTSIPWPESSQPDPETFEVDTPAMVLEDRSFRPYLLAAPMPVSVIDELRNKYSRFRTRHDAEYIEKKEAEAEREVKRKELGKTMRTPLQELAELRAQQKKNAERELSDEQMAAIGEVIEREEAKVLGEVEGMEKQETPSEAK